MKNFYISLPIKLHLGENKNEFITYPYSCIVEHPMKIRLQEFLKKEKQKNTE